MNWKKIKSFFSIAKIIIYNKNKYLMIRINKIKSLNWRNVILIIIRFKKSYTRISIIRLIKGSIRNRITRPYIIAKAIKVRWIERMLINKIKRLIRI